MIDGGETPHDPVLEGDGDSNLIAADHDPRPEGLVGGGGFDYLKGADGRQEMRGGEGPDFIQAGAGPDSIEGGIGPDTVHAGDGEDTLSDHAGYNGLFGGPDNDRLVAGDDASGGLEGQAGSDRLVLDGNAPVALVGGPGNDHYRLRSDADPARVIELARAGRDTIEASGGFTVPPDVERAVSAPGARVDILAGYGNQTLIGGRHGDTLDGGPGTDRLIGRGGGDKLRLDEFSFDRATGGPGADVFTPVATPPGVPLPDGFNPPASPSAHLIRDLRPARGDRIFLSRSSFGREVSELARRMVVREGGPRGHRPQLLLRAADRCCASIPTAQESCRARSSRSSPGSITCGCAASRSSTRPSASASVAPSLLVDVVRRTGPFPRRARLATRETPSTETRFRITVPEDQATLEIDQAATALRKLGSSRLLGVLYSGAAYSAIKAGRPERAGPHLAEVGPMVREQGDPFELAGWCGNAGLEALFSGDLDRAQVAFDEQPRLCREHAFIHIAADASAASRRSLPVAASRSAPHACSVRRPGVAPSVMQTYWHTSRRSSSRPHAHSRRTELERSAHRRCGDDFRTGDRLCAHAWSQWGLSGRRSVRSVAGKSDRWPDMSLATTQGSSSDVACQLPVTRRKVHLVA